MSHDTAVHTAVADSANAPVIEAIRTHHGELASELSTLTKAVLSAAQSGNCIGARNRLHDWYGTQLMPHIVAEEQALYSAASELDATRLLVCGMLSEHRALVRLVADLALAQLPFDVATIAASAEAMFNVHLGKENDLLLPAVDIAGLDLAVALAGMHEILGHTSPSACGCGCGCEHGETAASPVPVQLSSAPVFLPTPAPSAAAPGELDVRALPHSQRHEIIFAKLEALGSGDALVIINDHDPKPLRYQAETLWPGRFAWTYLDAGPQLWRLSIRRAD